MKLKIGVTCYPSVGGSGVVATELGKKLAERGHEIHFITSSMPFRLTKWTPNIYFHEVQVNQYSVFKHPPYDLTLASKMAEVAKREKLDILHVHYAIPHAVCAYLAKQMVGEHLKIVTTLHGTDITVLGYDPSLIDVIRLGIDQSDAVTAVSDHLIKQTYDIIETKKTIQTIYNFVDEKNFYKHDGQNIRKQYNIQEDEKVLIHISNFRRVKRIPDVIDMFVKVNENMKSRLILVGDGPEKTVVCRKIKEYGIEDKVLFLGNIDNVAEILSISDLMVLLSEKESFGLVFLEAMACGVPCLGTNIGGIPEVIEDGETGFICELGDVEGAARKAITILTDDQLHKKMSEKAIYHAAKKFSSEKIVQEYEKLYYRTINSQ